MTTQLSIRALNLYYARETNLREEVLATRLRASGVRASIGIPRGRVFRRVHGVPELPDVMWDCPFADVQGHVDDMDARAASPEFEAVRAHMRSLLRRFERVLYTTVRTAYPNPADAAETRITQLWIQRVGADPLDRDLLLEAIDRNNAASISVLQQLGEDKGLPDWIVEMPMGGQDPQLQSIRSALSVHTQLRALTSEWERCDGQP